MQENEKNRYSYQSFDEMLSSRIRLAVLALLVGCDEAEFTYKCDDFWHSEDEGGIIWNDLTIGIEWPKVDAELKLAAKDLKNPPFADGIGFPFE